jgi:hypothetical protein
MSIHAYRDHVFQKVQSHGDTFDDIEATYKTDKYIPEPRGMDSKRKVSMRESLSSSMHLAFLNSNPESPSYEEQKNYNESDVLLATNHSNLNKHGSVVDPEANAEPIQLLSVDHHYLTFFQFLWAEFFVSNNMRIRAAYGMVKLLICKPLYDRGWIDHTPDYNELVAKLVLETSFSEFYLGKKIDDSENVIGGFFCADFPYIEQNTSTKEVACKIADVFSVDIDLTNKRMVKANLDDEDLNASEALTLIWGFMSQAKHLQVHAFSNWGITVNERQFEMDPFIARNGIVTINYNYLGYSFADRIPDFHALLPETLLCKELNSEAITTIQNHGLSNMSWFTNPYLEDLYPYSDFVSFTEKLRPIFLEAFDGAKRIHFPGCNGDALFTATVFHSLEHTSGHWVFGDKSLFCFDTTHPRFGAGAQMGLLIEECFNEDLPFLTFHKRFKGSKHPFYEYIYEEAVKLNKKLADEMDTCIIK